MLSTRPAMQPCSRIPMKDALGFLAECLALDSIDAVIANCVTLSRSHSCDLSGGPAAVAERSILWLRQDEEEPEFAPLTDIFERMTKAALSERGQTLETFLADVAARYLDATKYLLPLLHHFARAVAFLALDQERSSITLFLRDAFFFWPPLTAHASCNPSPPIQFVRYTRDDQRLGNDPYVLREVRPGVFSTESSPSLTNTLAADVGLYGTLISALFDHEHYTHDIGVLFMVTRNPHLAGWLNFQLGASYFLGRSVSFPDLVNVADTIESLFKPFQMPIRNNGTADDPNSDIELSEIVTLCASVVFIWAAHRFSLTELAENKTTAADCLARLSEAKSAAGSWYMHTPVTSWPPGPDFLGSWSHGFTSPMDSIWCSKF
jgi:hypothetical protein